MTLKRTAGGRTNLHVWRTGHGYARQKGHLYLGEWNNVLFRPAGRRSQDPGVLAMDIRQPLPFAGRTFDAVYLLHILEHLTPREAGAVLREVWRILKPGAILRVSTPDLEDICRAYLGRLEDYGREPTDANLVRYEWAVLELIDQIVRVQSGGLMSQYVRRGRFDPAYAHLRYGDVFDEFAPRAGAPRPRAHPDRLTLRRAAGALRRRLWPRRETSPQTWSTGEVNKWLWDWFSLAMLMEEAGFGQPSRKTFRTSDIPEWDRFDFDRSSHGDHAIEPSLYMEARKPVS
jgi:SAM-dependent methyltransferase